MFKNTTFGVGGILLLSAVMLTSCGPESAKPVGDGFQETPLSLDPIGVVKQQVSCQRSFSREVDVRLTINQFFNGRSVQNRYDFFNELVGNYIQSPRKAPISEMVYGISAKETFTRTYNSETDDYDLEGFVQTYVKPRKLNVCPEVKSYNAYTFEEAGLNISNSITKTYLALKSVGVDLGPISVSVAPKILRVNRLVSRSGRKTKTVGYQVDNAFYHPIKKQITFLPQSETYRKSSDSAPFWQMPFVSAHEYGHHVFASLFGNKVRNGGEISEHCFLDHKYEEHEHTEVIAVESEDQKRDNSSKFAVSAMNEGFSDLISLYSLGKEQGSAKNVPCFEKTREAASPFNFYGVRKVFNRAALKKMNSEKVIRSSKKCHDLNFQQIHKVGAVFAYSFDSILNKVNLSTKEKLEVLVKWLIKLQKNHSRLEGEVAGDYIFKSLELALVEVKSFVDSDPDLVARACDAFEDVFPNKRSDHCSDLM